MQKMLCDAFLFKNVICVINSRMCLALECLTVLFLNEIIAYFIEREKFSKRHKWVLIYLMRIFLEQGKSKDCIRPFFFGRWFVCVCVCFMISMR